MFQILFLTFTDFLFAYSPYYLIPVSALLRFQNLLAFFFLLTTAAVTEVLYFT